MNPLSFGILKTRMMSGECVHSVWGSIIVQIAKHGLADLTEFYDESFFYHIQCNPNLSIQAFFHHILQILYLLCDFIGNIPIINSTDVLIVNYLLNFVSHILGKGPLTSFYLFSLMC